MHFFRNRFFRLIFVSLLGIGLAVLLITLLIQFTNLDISTFLGIFLETSEFTIVSVLLMMAINLSVGALKWKLVIEHLQDKTSRRPSFMFYLFYTSLGAFFGLFLPVQVTTLLVRGTSFRAGWGSMRKGMITSLFSQTQDFILIAIFLIPGLFLITGNTSFPTWALSVLLLLFFGYVFFHSFAAKIVNNLANIQIQPKPSKSQYPKIIHKFQEVFTVMNDMKLWDRSLVIPLYCLSLLRFLNLALRSYIISQELGLGVSPFLVFSMSSIVQLSLIVAVTPGNLGLLEWGWVGLLRFVGIHLTEAANFALVSRIFGYGSTILVFTVILIIFFGLKIITKDKRNLV